MVDELGNVEDTRSDGHGKLYASWGIITTKKTIAERGYRTYSIKL